LGTAVQTIAAGIGLASESYHRYKEKKKAEKAEKAEKESPRSSEPGPDEDETAHDSEPAELGQVDEAAWDLDDAQCEVIEEHRDHITVEELPKLASDFIARHPHTGSPIATNHLALPVVITQRRPKTRARGFVRAYAPLLEEVDLSQAVFLDFLDKLNLAIQPNPWIQAINLASMLGNLAPNPFSFVISYAVKLMTDAISEVHSRHKTNAFLDRMNEDFFKPRGLVCLVMTWKPESAGQLMTTVEFETGVAGASDTSHLGSLGKVKHNLQASSLKSGFEWPETAPLIFPALDELAGGQHGEKKKEGVLKRGGKFVGDYMDRRARAKWAGQNPDSKMANSTPMPEFHSRYADPNNPAASGDILALLTGGHLQGGLGRMGTNQGASDGRGVGRGLGGRLGGGFSRGYDTRHGERSDGRFGGGLGGARGINPREDALRARGWGVGPAGAPGGPGVRRGLGDVGIGGGIAGTGIGPLSLVTGTKKLLVQVSRLNRFSETARRLTDFLYRTYFI